MAGIAIGKPSQVILMLWFGLPEIADRLDLGHDPAGPLPRGFHIRDGALGLVFLILIDVIDRRAIAHPEIIALLVGRGRVVDLKEEFQKVAIAYSRRIKDDLDSFGMGAVIAVGGVRHIAAGIADARADHPVKLADQILHAPETASGQNCTFRHVTSSTWSR